MTLNWIKQDIERLIAEYEKVRIENSSLRSELERNITAVEDCKKRINELEREIDNLKLTGIFVSASNSNIEAKARIDRMIKEIDKCISLMEE